MLLLFLIKRAVLPFTVSCKRRCSFIPCYLQTDKIWVAALQNQHMFSKKFHLHWIAKRANILSKYIKYIFFNFGHGFCCWFSMLLPKAPASCFKEVSQILKILLQAEDINIFVLCGVFFRRYVQLKRCFSDEKNISGEIWDT